MGVFPAVQGKGWQSDAGRRWEVLEATGGGAGLQDLLFRAGQPFPSHQRLHNWKARNSIPGAWTGAILWALACSGVDPMSLLEDLQPNTAPQDDTDEQDAA